MKAYGSIWTAAPWAALSLGMSAVRSMCLEFPGLRWRASLKCPQHKQEMMISSAATRRGDKLLLGKTCSLCRSETGGLGAAATDLLEMIDVLQSKDDIFRATHGRLVKLQDKYPVLRPEVSRDLHPEQVRRQFDDWLGGMKEEMENLFHTERESSEEGAKFQQLVGDLQQQLGQQHQDVREWLGALGAKRLADVVDADDGVMDRLDFVVAMLMAMRKDNSDTPRLACVLPPWQFAEAHGLSEDEQTPDVWLKRLGEWREDDFKEGKGVFKKKKRLFLVCAHTNWLVPCGPNGHGYDIEQPRTWFRMSVGVMTFALQVLCTTLSTMAVAPLSSAGAAFEGTISAAMGNFESLLQNQLAGLALDDGAGSAMDVMPQVEKTLTSMFSLQQQYFFVYYVDFVNLTYPATRMRNKLRACPHLRVVPSLKTAQPDGRVYAHLWEFIHGVEDAARLEMFKARKKAHRERRAPRRSSEFVFFTQKMTQVQSHSGDAAVQWVMKGQEDAWYESQKRPAPIA